MTAEPLTILLAEDDDGHATLIFRNLERAGLVVQWQRHRATGRVEHLAEQLPLGLGQGAGGARLQPLPLTPIPVS